MSTDLAISVPAGGRQTVLPFREWKVSPRWGQLLAIVNAWAGRTSSYEAAKFSIYRLKDVILTRHGVPDGTDLQIITLYCRACHGAGWHGPQWRREGCWTCWGSGVYARDYIILARYRIGDRVFHIPNGASRFRVMDREHYTHWRPTGEGHVNVIQGIVAHEPISPRWRWLAFLALALRFAPKHSGLVVSLWSHEQRRAVHAWWRWGGGAVWRYRCEAAWTGRPVNWSKDSEAVTADEVPF